MARDRIDTFSFLKQSKADISPAYRMDRRAISADYWHGFWREIFQAHAYFEEKIREDR